MRRPGEPEGFDVTLRDGSRLRAFWHGPESELPPILFVHGLGSSATDWEGSARFFAERGRRVLTIDLRGHGRSDKDRSRLPISRHASNLLEVLEELGIERLDLVGLSLGGQIALEMIAREPERFERVVVACCALDTRRHRPKVLAQWLARSLVLNGLGLRSSTHLLARALFPKPEQQKLRDDFETEWLKNDVRAYRRALQGAFGWHARGRLAAFEGPVLVIGADRDFIPLRELEAIKGEFRDARLVVVEDCGHAIPAERPDEWNRVLGDFLARDGVSDPTAADA